MRPRRALAVAVVVMIVLMSMLMCVRSYNERFHVSEGSDTGITVGTVLEESGFPSDDSRLWVYGNANEDDVIDRKDVEYLRGIIYGDYPETVLADANCDGVVDRRDLAYLERMLVSDSMDVFYVDNYFTVSKVSWPVGSIAIGYCSGAYVVDLAGLTGKVMMVDSTIRDYWAGMSPDFSKAESYGTTESPNYEKMISCGIDVYVVGYCDANADLASPEALNPAGIDVMFMSTADNSGVDIPNESIDRSILMFSYLLQGDLDKTYAYLEWHDSMFDLMGGATSGIPQDRRESMVMARSSPLYASGTYSITGKDNTNNIHAEWVGVNAVGQHDSQFLPKNYNSLDQEMIITLLKKHQNNGLIFYVDNAHDGMRKQYDLGDCLAADSRMLSSSDVQIYYMGMAREMGNSPLYVVEAAFYVCIMYPDVAEAIGLDYKELFEEYFRLFASYDYWQDLDIEDFFLDYGIA